MRAGGLRNFSPNLLTSAIFLFSPTSQNWNGSFFPGQGRGLLRRRINLENNPQRILIGRKDVQVRCELLDENQYRLLEELTGGRTLEEACETLAGTSGDEEIPVSGWFFRWAQDGLIREVKFPTEGHAPKPLSSGEIHRA